MSILNIARLTLTAMAVILLMVISYNTGKMTVTNPQVVSSKIGQKVTQIVTYADKKVENNKTLYKNPHSGTAFLLFHKGKQLVLTNSHVCGTQEGSEKRRGEIILNKVRFELDIVAQDPTVDLCLLKAKTTFYDGEFGVMLSEEAPALSSAFGTFGFNGIALGVPQVGQFLGNRTIFTQQSPYIDHEPTDRGLKINNFFLPEQKRAALCVAPNKLEIIEHPLAALAPHLNIPKYFSCMMPESQDVYSFFTVPGASGSPVIDVESGRLVGVISQWVHDQRMYAGVIPFQQLKDFIESNVP